MERQKRIIEQDIEDEIMSAKKKRKDEPDIEFYERAYTNFLIPRVMGVSGKQGKGSFSKHDQANFRRDVLRRYSASRAVGGLKMAYCHLSGW